MQPGSVNVECNGMEFGVIIMLFFTILFTPVLILVVIIIICVCVFQQDIYPIPIVDLLISHNAFVLQSKICDLLAQVDEQSKSLIG